MLWSADSSVGLSTPMHLRQDLVHVGGRDLFRLGLEAHLVVCWMSLMS